MNDHAGPRRIVVLRHGETLSNRERVWQGQLDTELSELGLRQAQHAAAALTAYQPVAVVSSDLRRAADTAEAVADAAGITLRLDPRLREVHVGQWQGMPGALVKERYADLLSAIDRGEDLAKGVTGETVAQVASRVHAALDDVLAGLGPGQTCVVVAHGVSARAAVAELVGIDQGVASRAFRTMDNCHWADVVEQRALFSSADAPLGWRLAAWNRGAPQPVGAETPA